MRNRWVLLFVLGYNWLRSHDWQQRIESVFQWFWYRKGMRDFWTRFECDLWVRKIENTRKMAFCVHLFLEHGILKVKTVQEKVHGIKNGRNQGFRGLT